MKMEFFAHSENARGERDKLTDHLLRAAELARSFAPSKELEHLFYLAGLVHDVGKFQLGFQQYLEFGHPRTPHAGIGAFIARGLFRQLLPLPFVIKGHHAGMPDKEELSSALQLLGDEADKAQEVETRLRDCFPDLVSMIGGEHRADGRERLLLECTTRFLFSALTDADWLDTERHFDPDKSSARSKQGLNHEVLLEALEKEFTQLPRKGIINQLRTNARVEAAGQFAEPPGFFSLQLPTGLGKTLTSVYWALLHARHNKLKRIIIVLPYINIIDQTALILKKLFGEETVLEHHSGVFDDDEEYSSEKLEKGRVPGKQLACENWDAPIIVTTAVQFFESLFSNRPFKCRKNHSIADAVVIFDEIQTLPKHLAEPTIVMLKNVASIARTSFLFCTATMPAFGKNDVFDGVDSIAPLIKAPKKYFSATKRVDYRLLKNLKPVALEEVSKELLKVKDSYLVIVNTKSVAKELFTQLKKGNAHDRYYHLSTAMCPHHRKKTISEIIDDLDPKKGKSIAVVSTQLVEAGVDLDFPCVYRAIAPLDAVIQAAGRCNRNGSMKKGKVVLFDLLQHRMPDSTYRSCADFAKGLIKDDPEALHKHETFERYYEQVVGLFVNPDRFGITEERKNFNFKTVDEQYQIIEKGRTVPLLVQNYSVETEALWKKAQECFEQRGFISKELHANLQQYSVQVYRNFLNKYDKQIGMHESGLRVWYGGYDNDTGLAPDDVETVF
jgi:CRISPR-associated endonuclease/helicase Cas3